MSEVVTRFPPSPTGHLHIGGARTAIFNWLFARHHGGKFILRIEDTDRVRSTEEAIRVIPESMEWLGLDWDEGPYFQTERLDIYREYARRLVAEGKAYWCACQPEELEARRKKAMALGLKPKYDGTCREKGLSEQPGAVIRFRAPQEGRTVFDDIIKGPIGFENAELDDLIILRSDAVPTYNFAVVIDDVTMGITHVIRGDDHVNNTPRQIQLYEALGAKLPLFGHVPMILGTDKARLSKRHGATSVLAYREMGYLPQALLNYLVRLGWSYGDQEIFSRAELIEKFTLDNIGRAAGVFNPDKLLWLNAHYIKESSPEELAPLLEPFVESRGCGMEREVMLKVIPTLQTRSRTLVEMADGALFYCRLDGYEPEAAKKFLTTEAAGHFKEMVARLSAVEPFGEEQITAVVHGYAEEKGLKLGAVAQPMRVALTGSKVSPGLFELMAVLGKVEVLSRLERAISYVETRGTPR